MNLSTSTDEADRIRRAARDYLADQIRRAARDYLATQNWPWVTTGELSGAISTTLDRPVTASAVRNALMGVADIINERKPRTGRQYCWALAANLARWDARRRECDLIEGRVWRNEGTVCIDGLMYLTVPEYPGLNVEAIADVIVRRVIFDLKQQIMKGGAS